MKRYFITGAQGFVGRYVISELVSSHPGCAILGAGRSPRLTDTFTYGVRRGISSVPAPVPDGLVSGYAYVSVDLSESERLCQLLQEFRPDVVIHLASGMPEDAADRLYCTNVGGTIRLLGAIAESGVDVQRIVVISTGGVYGVPLELPIAEGARCEPVDIYSATKLASEHASRIVANRYELPVIWARIFNLVGPGQNERHLCADLVAQLAAVVKGVAPPMIQVRDLQMTRDFIDVRDAAAALELISGRGIPGQVYNVASGRETPVREVLEVAIRLACLEGRVDVQRRTFQAAVVPRHCASIDRLRSLGFAWRYSLSQSVADVLKYYDHTFERELRTVA